QREPSYIGVHDLGAFSGAALSLGFASLLLRLRRREGPWAALTGAFVTALAGIALVRRRGPIALGRIATVIAICALVTLGAVTLRGSAIKAFLRFLGVSAAAKQETQIQTYAQRTLLAYIGVEIWIHHPVLGVGWQESELPHGFEPYLARARARFPNAAPQSFPSKAHTWGVQ